MGVFFKKIIIIFFVLNSCIHIESSTRRIVTGLKPLSRQSFGYNFYSTTPNSTTQSPKGLLPKAIADKNSSSSLLEWGVAGGTAGAAFTGYVMYKDYKDKQLPSIINPFDKPNFSQIVAYLKIALKDVKVAPNFDIQLVAYRLNTGNFYYNDIENIITNVKKSIKKKKLRFISMEDFQEAYYDLKFGIADDREAIDSRKNAYHEAGHAFAEAMLYGQISRIDYVAIKPRGDFGGFVNSFPLEQNVINIVRHFLEYKNGLVINFAGGVSQQYSSEKLKKLKKSDLKEFFNLEAVGSKFDKDSDAYFINLRSSMMAIILCYFEAMLSRDQEKIRNFWPYLKLFMSGQAVLICDNNVDFNKKRNEILEETFAKTVDLISQNQDAIKKLADVIYEERAISGQKVYDILDKPMPILSFEYDRIIDQIERYYDYR